MAKITRTQTIAAFINATPSLGMDESCLEMTAQGMFKNNSEARDWFRYVVRQGHIKHPVVITKGRAVPKNLPPIQQEINERKAALAQATVGEPAEDEDFTPPAFLTKEDSVKPETRNERKARMARERRAAKKAQAA